MGTKWLHDAELYVDVWWVTIKIDQQSNSHTSPESLPKEILSQRVHTQIEWLKLINAVC